MLAVQLIILMFQRLVVTPDVPLAQPDPHPVDGSGGHAVTGGDDPPVRDERTAATDSPAQEGLLDQRGLPRVVAELGVVSAHYAIGRSVHLAAF